MLHFILKYSIQHRQMIVLLTIAVGILGFFSFLRLPIDAVPDISNKIVQITTVCPELSPAEVEKQVAFPIETAMAGIPGLRSTRSLTRNGFSQVEAIFEDDINIYFARQQVLERLAEAREHLPELVDPRMGPVTTGLGEIVVYVVEYEHPEGGGAVQKDGHPGWQTDSSYLTPEGESLRSEFEQVVYLRTIQDWLIKPQLQSVRDVAGIDTIGGFEKQYLVQPDPMKLLSYGLTLNDLLVALERNNSASGAGFIDYRGESYVVRADGRVRNAEEIGSILLTSKNGTPIYVRDVAEVGIGKELRTGSASQNGKEVVVGTVLMLSGANSRTVAAHVTDKIADIQKSLPSDIRIRPVLVRTELINHTIDTVKHNLFLGAVLVITVLLLLLGNIRAAVITAMAIPLAMLFTAIGMEFLGISGNLMSLGAIDFGLIVDGAVIIVENCMRQISRLQKKFGRMLTREERLEVVLNASSEVRSATAFGEAIIIMVYFPILALTGVEGKMFHPMALTVICALAAAFILSLTFIPAMIALFISGPVRDRENWIMSLAHRLYQPLLNKSLMHPWSILGASLCIVIGAAGLFSQIGQELVPKLDEGNISLQSLRIPSTSLAQSQSMQFNVEKAVSALPEVALMYSKTGTAEVAFDPMPPNISDGYVIFKPRSEWPDQKLSKTDLIEKIRHIVEDLPGNLYEFSQPIELRINELVAGVRGDLAVKVYGDDFSRMAPIAQQIALILQEIPGATDVKTTQAEGFPSMEIDIDRSAIARYGLTISDIQDVIKTAIGGTDVGMVFEGDRRFSIVVRLPEEIRSDINALARLPVSLTTGAGSGMPDPITEPNAQYLSPVVPLGSIAKIQMTEGLGQINRENGKRRLVVQANVSNRDLGSFVSESKKRIESEIEMDSNTWLDWGGQYEHLLMARNRLLIIVPICLFMIFLFLYSTFNSSRYALLVFTGVPLALTGGIAALWIRGIAFSISAAVGFIALSGIGVLNGLVMVTTINQLRREGAGLEESIRQGSLMRLRPVLMTAMVASLGFVPMALATSTGAEVQRPLATVVIGGIISSTFLTLFVLPALYRIWNDDDSQ